MHIRPVRLSFVLMASIVVLAACGAPTPPLPDAPSVAGVAYPMNADDPGTIAVGWVMVAPAYASAAVAVTELVEIQPDVFVGEFVLPDDDGAFSVRLPAAADISAAALMPLADAVMNFGACAVDATPAGAQATYTAYEGIAIPGLIGLETQGTALMIATDVMISRPADVADVTAYAWIFLDRDARLTTSGCDYVADLTLAEGWNQLAWTTDPPAVFVDVVPTRDVYATMFTPFPPPLAPLAPGTE